MQPQLGLPAPQNKMLKACLPRCGEKALSQRSWQGWVTEQPNGCLNALGKGLDDSAWARRGSLASVLTRPQAALASLQIQDLRQPSLRFYSEHKNLPICTVTQVPAERGSQS